MMFSPGAELWAKLRSKLAHETVPQQERGRQPSLSAGNHTGSSLGMNRLQKSLILVAAIAIPAAAHSTFAPTKDTLCFASGATTYQIARNAAAPDFRIKIADASAGARSADATGRQRRDRRFRAGRRLQRQGAGALPLLDADPDRDSGRRRRGAGRHGQSFGRSRPSPTTRSMSIRCGSRSRTPPPCSPPCGRPASVARRPVHPLSVRRAGPR